MEELGSVRVCSGSHPERGPEVVHEHGGLRVKEVLNPIGRLFKTEEFRILRLSLSLSLSLSLYIYIYTYIYMYMLYVHILTVVTKYYNE